MASAKRSGGDPSSEIWGTWEELLLASAVSRHGTCSWDSVAMEVQTRSPFPDLLTPHSCRLRYIELRRRFESSGGGINHEADGSDDGVLPSDAPWVEELRKLRMAELRREVERYDVSITSLQLKLKNLRAEQREGNEAGEGEPDLKDRKKNHDGESPGSVFFRDRLSGGSCKESNSTDLKAKDGNPGDTAGGGGDVGGEGTEPEEAMETGCPAAVSRPGREASYNGSSETLDKGAKAANEAAPPAAGESGESVAGETGEKESSDVQSSASLSRRRRGRRRKAAVSGSSSVAEEVETETVSPVPAKAKRIAASELQPMAAFLEIIRASKYGSVFMRRLDGQESATYRSVIRRHVDLEIVQGRLERRGGKYSNAEFFRDLLLLCNNAIVFYPEGSSESIAAGHLRKMVAKEIASLSSKPAPSTAEVAANDQPSPPPFPKVVTKLKLDPDLANSLPKKNRSSSGSLFACRKRSSISKAVTATDAEAIEEEEKEQNSSSVQMERDRDGDKQTTVAKPKTKERSKVSAARGLRTNKSRSGSVTRNSKVAPSPKPNPMAEEVSEAMPPPKLDKKAPATALTPKKRNAASFLNRLKANSSSSGGAGTLLSSLKSGGGSGGKGTEQKRGGKGEGRKETASSSPQDPGPPAKRSVGRPPKRLALTPSPPPAKRTKVEAAPPQRKRGRK